MLDAFAEAEVVPGIVAFAEGAQSVDDANTLSGLDPSATGGAYETGLRLDALAVGLGEVSGRVVRRYRADDFRTLDRVRRVDFNRRWNLARAGAPFESALDSLGEASTEAQATWALTERTRIGVDVGALEIRDFRARRAGVEAVVADLPSGPLPAWAPLVRYTLDAVASDSGTVGFLGSGSFFRQAASAERSLGAWTPSLALAQERRQQDGDALPQDTLLAPSYRFVSLRPGLAYERSRVRAAGAVEIRRESEPLAPAGTPGDLADASRSLGAEVEAQVRGGGGARAEVRAAYRRTRYRDEFRQLGREDVESLALSSTVRASPFSRAVDLRASYEALTERTPVLQEAYVLVGAEAGQFVWRDGEGEPRAGEPDGRQQVDEFFPETTPFEGTYLRTFVPSDELFPAIGVGGQLAVRFDGARLGEGTGWARALEARASVEVREQSTSDDVLRVLLFDPGVLQQPGADGMAGTVDGRFRADADVALWPRRRPPHHHPPAGGGRGNAASAERPRGRTPRARRGRRLAAYAPRGAPTVGQRCVRDADVRHPWDRGGAGAGLGSGGGRQPDGRGAALHPDGRPRDGGPPHRRLRRARAAGPPVDAEPAAGGDGARRALRDRAAGRERNRPRAVRTDRRPRPRRLGLGRRPGDGRPLGVHSRHPHVRSPRTGRIRARADRPGLGLRYVLGRCGESARETDGGGRG